MLAWTGEVDSLRVRVSPQGFNPASLTLLHVQAAGGHYVDGGRFRRLEGIAMGWAFLTHALGVGVDGGSR